jgi:putative ABC transport system substrate-binding protein
LRELGYSEGENIVLVPRWSEGRDEQFPALAAELVSLNITAIITVGTPASLAAKHATTTIPIIMAAVGDPVGTGLVTSLARPGGNLTGLSLLDEELDGKRLDLLKEAVRGLSRVGVLWSATDPGMTLAFHRVRTAGQTLGLQLLDMAVQDASRFEGAFQVASSGHAQALLVLAQPFTRRHQAQIVDLALRSRLPAMYTLRFFVDAGGLMAYGPSVPDLVRRAAAYVDKILRGAKPADLPVEQPTKFDLVINLKTAKALGLTIPQSVLVRADEVIQ